MLKTLNTHPARSLTFDPLYFLTLYTLLRFKLHTHESKVYPVFLSSVYCFLSAMSGALSTVNCLLFTFYCLHVQ